MLYNPCSGSKKAGMCMPFLASEIIFQILLCLPAEFIYNVARHVCREWHNMIKDPPIFIDAHLAKSSRGIFIQGQRRSASVTYVEAGHHHDLGITDLVWSLEGWGDRRVYGASVAKFPSFVSASCDGLVLLTGISRVHNIYHVANPITKQGKILPPLNDIMPHSRFPGLACAASSQEYKVVQTGTMSYGNYKRRCAILTLGMDKAWRFLDLPHHIPPTPNDGLRGHILLEGLHNINSADLNHFRFHLEPHEPYASATAVFHDYAKSLVSLN